MLKLLMRAKPSGCAVEDKHGDTPLAIAKAIPSPFSSIHHRQEEREREEDKPEEEGGGSQLRPSHS